MTQKNILFINVFKVLAHELGHTFGMLHDFDINHGGSGNECDGKGIMSYGNNKFMEATNQWSECSKSDFEHHYTAQNWGCTCLDDISGKIFLEPR